MWILIMTITSISGASAIHSVEFSSKSAAETAGMAWMSKNSDFRAIDKECLVVSKGDVQSIEGNR